MLASKGTHRKPQIQRSLLPASAEPQPLVGSPWWRLQGDFAAARTEKRVLGLADASKGVMLRRASNVRRDLFNLEFCSKTGGSP